MKISTKGRYGIRFMIDLASRAHEETVPLSDVSKRQRISEKYLWQVVTPLRAKGLVEVTRGANGGYRLARRAKAITVREIIEVLEGGLRLVPESDSKNRARTPNEIVADELWDTLTEALAKAMEAITLADLVERKQQLKGPLNDFVI